MKKKKSVLRSRVIPALLIVTVSLLTLCSLDGWLFRILFGILCALAIYELSSLRYTIQLRSVVNYESANFWRFIAYIFVICGGFYVFFSPQTQIFLLFVCAWGADALGWAVGSLIGKRFISKIPFPALSPKKTWEGTIAHLLGPALIFGILLWLRQVLGHPLFGTIDVNPSQVYCTILGPLVLLGDLFGSKVKRAFGTKDSCNHASFEYQERIKWCLGDHGGAFDRIDSIVVTGAVLLLIGWFCIFF